MISREYSALAVIVVTGLMCSGGGKQNKSKQQPECSAAGRVDCCPLLSLSLVSVTVRYWNSFQPQVLDNQESCPQGLHQQSQAVSGVMLAITLMCAYSLCYFLLDKCCGNSYCRYQSCNQLYSDSNCSVNRNNEVAQIGILPLELNLHCHIDMFTRHCWASHCHEKKRFQS